MNRVIRGHFARKKRRNITNENKGFVGSHSKLFSVAKQQYMKAKVYAYFHRRKKKRDYRKLWITRINAILSIHELKYKEVIKKLKKDKIKINRKILAKICLIDKKTLKTIVK